MSTVYYIVDEKAKAAHKKEYENLLDLIEKINDIVEMYSFDGKLSIRTLDDIQNSLNTWKWFVDKEYGYYRFLQTTAQTYTFFKCCDEDGVYQAYQNIYTSEQALQFVDDNEGYNIYDEYGHQVSTDYIRKIIKNRLGTY